MSMSLLIACLMCVALTQATSSVHARFGKQVIHSDFAFGDDYMLVHIERPVNAPANFRQTDNLHIFPTNFVAMRNAQDNQCYIRRFVESEDRMRGRVENAEFNNGQLDVVYEEAIDVNVLDTISAKVARELLGDRIADFCANHEIFVITPDDHHRLNPQDLEGRTIQKRAASAVIAASHCDCPPRPIFA